MFLRCATKLAAPDAWVCALAAVAINPSTITAAVKVNVSVLMTFSFANAGKMHRDSSVVSLSQPDFKPTGLGCLCSSADRVSVLLTGRFVRLCAARR
jgi:hypothetical protein